jgi:type IV secretion system protein VirB9
VARGDMPPLFAIGASGAAELVNYRVAGRYMIVDRLFERAELRLASGKRGVRVSIVREGARRKGRS